MIFTLFTILSILMIWWFRYPRKRVGNRKRVRWNRPLRYLCTLVLGLQENFMQSLSVFLLFFGDKKRITSKISIFFHPYITEFWFGYLWLKFEGKIHTKAIANVSRGGGSFVSCSAWEGTNDVPRERKGLPGGPEVGENYTD